jgi:transcriptional regulator with XRE-family HTH domain
MFSQFDEKVLANYLTSYIKKNNLTLEFVSQKSGVSLSTVKNLCSGKTPNPGILNALPIIYAVGGTPEEMVFGENQDVVKEFSIDSIKEMCEQAIAEIVRTNEIHITNVRSHYEQHREDFKESQEKQDALKDKLYEEKSKESNLFKILTCVLATILIGLLILEVANPNLGWLRF